MSRWFKRWKVFDFALYPFAWDGSICRRLLFGAKFSLSAFKNLTQSEFFGVKVPKLLLSQHRYNSWRSCKSWIVFVFNFLQPITMVYLLYSYVETSLIGLPEQCSHDSISIMLCRIKFYEKLVAARENWFLFS